MARTVKPDGERIKALRVAKGWNAEELATKAGCSTRDMSSIESSSPCYVFTLKSVADALSVEPSQIMLHEIKQIPVVPHMVTVDLSFSISMQLTADTQIINLIESLKVMIRAAHSVEVQGFREGSLIVTVTMAESDLYRLAAAFSDGELESTGITEIKQVNLEMGSMLVFPIVLNKQTIMARRLQDLGTEPPVGQGGSPLGIQDVILPPYVPRKEKVDTPPDEL